MGAAQPLEARRASATEVRFLRLLSSFFHGHFMRIIFIFILFYFISNALH
tara:strand:- start:349 stop:498 length:150 start_codon:yes stop_codon:yes gene_type:complete